MKSGRRDSPIPLRKLDRDAIELVKRLRRFGHTAYIVGGCVRDLLVGQTPKDFDVSTSARPEEIRKIFRNSRIIGRRFRLAHIYFRGGKIIETATFRGSGPADDEDGERDGQDLLITRDNVWGSEEEDARRRDFTINALMYDVTSGRIIDHVGGLPDLEARIVRTIGPADIRVQEDPVRILRAARFSAKLGFQIDPELASAMRAYKLEIARCPRARVLEETFKLLRSGHAEQSIYVLRETQVLDAVLPELSAHIDAVESSGARPQLYKDLRALDELVARRGFVSDAIVLAAVLLAPLDLKTADLPPHAVLQETQTFVAEFADWLGATRRTRERLRQVFAAQRYLQRPPAGRRSRRRVAPSSLLKRSYFIDALDLFEIWAAARGESLAEVNAWRQKAGDAPQEEVDGAEDEPRRRRRSRKTQTEVEPREVADSDVRA